MPIFLTGATKWPRVLFTGMGNIEGADPGIKKRSPVSDMLSLRCCRTSKLRLSRKSCICGSGAQEKDRAGKIWTRESPAF